ncbi:MAG: glycerol-3-phosphate 1-O-acyltransferase PlsY [Firmicutes bacterium]|nr:glycerol-3-phosphate 1-O-acyltransferase PlsY [Bacillota bacterium]
MDRLWCILLGYAFGCIQTAYIVGKLTRKIDIRDYGSGNSGATNAIRVLGTKVGLICMAGDILKGLIALIVASYIFGYDQKYLLLYTGIGAVLGHNFPFYMGFRGGKGVAVTIGIMAFMDYRIFLIAGIPALIVLAATRYMSLASLLFVTIFPICTAVFYLGQPHGLEVTLLSLFFTVMIYWRHHSNIERLLKGTERRVGEKVLIKTEDQKLAEKKQAEGKALPEDSLPPKPAKVKKAKKSRKAKKRKRLRRNRKK